MVIFEIATNISEILSAATHFDESKMVEHFIKIESQIGPDEARALFRICMQLPEHTKILEIGSYKGGSAVAMGHACIEKNLQLYCLDMWSSYNRQREYFNRDIPVSHDRQVLLEFLDNTDFIGSRLCMLRGATTQFFDVFSGNSDGVFSLVFIDGAHDYYSVAEDIILGLKVIKAGGFLCGHDYHSSGLDVVRAVDDVIMKSETIVRKGLINYTSIWYAVIDDPEYELLIAKVVRYMARGDFATAYNKLMNEIETVKHTGEIDRLVKGLEVELGIRGEMNNRRPI